MDDMIVLLTGRLPFLTVCFRFWLRISKKKVRMFSFSFLCVYKYIYMCDFYSIRPAVFFNFIFLIRYFSRAMDSGQNQFYGLRKMTFRFFGWFLIDFISYCCCVFFFLRRQWLPQHKVIKISIKNHQINDQFHESR